MIESSAGVREKKVGKEKVEDGNVEKVEEEKVEKEIKEGGRCSVLTLRCIMRVALSCIDHIVVLRSENCVRPRAWQEFSYISSFFLARP